MVSSTVKLIQDALDSNQVVVFSKTYCPYCVRAKKLLDQKKIAYELFELDLRDDGNELHSQIINLTKQRTVPNIFINGSSIGGCDNLMQAERSGKLDQLLAQKL